MWFHVFVMQTLQLTYEDLNFEMMIKISQLADLLGVTPKRAKEIFLAEAVAIQNKKQS